MPWSLLLYLTITIYMVNVLKGETNRPYGFAQYYQRKLISKYDDFQLRYCSRYFKAFRNIGDVFYRTAYPYTLFALKNDVMRDYIKQHGDNKFSERLYIESHKFRGKMNSSLLQKQETITSINKKRFIVNSVYDARTKQNHIWVQGVTVNLPPIKSTHGLIYEINDYLTEPNLSLLEYLKNSSYHKIIYKMLRKQSLYFQFIYGVTFLAPFDRAFEQLPTKYKNELLKNDSKQRNFIHNHIIFKPMCRERLFYHTGWSRVINNLGTFLRLYQNDSDFNSSYVNGALVVKSVAVREGWLYGITETLLPETKYNVLEMLRELHCHTFLHYVINAGYMHTLESLLEKFTLFAPTDKAFEKLPVKIRERMTTDQQYFRSIIQYHLVKGRYMSDQFDDVKSVKTYLENKRTGNRLFINVHYVSNISTVQDKRIISFDHFAINGLVHILQNVMIPPIKSILDILKSKKIFRNFRRLLKTSNSSLLKSLSNDNQQFTVIVPLNHAIKEFFYLIVRRKRFILYPTNISFKQLLINIENKKIMKMLSRHVYPDFFLPVKLKSREEIKLKVKKLNGKSINIVSKGNTLKTQNCKSVSISHTIVAKNGIVIIVDRVIGKDRKILARV